jgi:uncharacterized membrane protein
MLDSKDRNIGRRPSSRRGVPERETLWLVRALPVHPEPLWRTDFRQRIAVSLWFVPTLFAAGAVAVAYLAVWLDERIDEPVGARFGLVSDPATATSFAGTIAAATLAFVAVVFATTLVAIQLAASQYSPRTVRVFIRSRVTREHALDQHPVH